MFRFYINFLFYSFFCLCTFQRISNTVRKKERKKKTQIYFFFFNSWEWWICSVLCAIIQSVLGEFLCYRRELQYIPIKKKKSKEKKEEEKEETQIKLEDLQV